MKIKKKKNILNTLKYMKYVSILCSKKLRNFNNFVLEEKLCFFNTSYYDWPEQIRKSIQICALIILIISIIRRFRFSAFQSRRVSKLVETFDGKSSKLVASARFYAEFDSFDRISQSIIMSKVLYRPMFLY